MQSEALPDNIHYRCTHAVCALCGFKACASVWVQDLENLDVLKVGEDNNEQALVDLQLSLAAYTQVVVKSLGDSIPKLVYAQLVGKVCPKLV